MSRPTCSICHLLYIKVLSFVCETTNSIAFSIVAVAAGILLFVSGPLVESMQAPSHGSVSEAFIGALAFIEASASRLALA